MLRECALSTGSAESLPIITTALRNAGPSIPNGAGATSRPAQPARFVTQLMRVHSRRSGEFSDMSDSDEEICVVPSADSGLPSVLRLMLDDTVSPNVLLAAIRVSVFLAHHMSLEVDYYADRAILTIGGPREVVLDFLELSSFLVGLQFFNSPAILAV